MRQGERRGTEVDLLDFTYDGKIKDRFLSGGLGKKSCRCLVLCVLLRERKHQAVANSKEKIEKNHDFHFKSRKPTHLK